MGSALGVLQEGTCWGLSFPVPGYSPPHPQLLSRVVWNPHPGSGGLPRPAPVGSGTPASSVADPRPCSGDFAPLRRKPGSWGCCGSKAGCGWRGLRWAARRRERWPGREGQSGEGSPHRSPLLVSQPRDRRAEGDARASLPPTSRCHPLPFMRPSVHSCLSHSFNISASGHSPRIQSAPTVCRRPCLGSLGESQCRRNPSAASPSGGGGGHRWVTGVNRAPAPPPARL